MRRVIICIIMSFIFMGMVSKAETSDKLSTIEKEIKSYGGENISIEKRVENAEIYVFGEKKSGNINNRIDNLSNVLGLADIKNEEAKYEIEDDVMANYPVIDELEQKIFNQVYKENIYKRLERLEKKTENRVFDDKPLNERVSYLKEKYLLQNTFEEETPEYNNNNYQYYSPQTYKKSNNDNFEKKYYSKQFDKDDEVREQEKIEAIRKAKQTNKEYKVNKFAKYATTAIQIGGIALLILAIVL